MSTHVINIRHHPNPKDMLDFFNKNKPRKGDKIKLTGAELNIAVAALFIVAVAALALSYYFEKKKKQEDSGKLLGDLFSDYKSPEEIEKHIEEEYGIKVELESTDTDRKEWLEFSMQGLGKSYSQDEPDITGMIVCEPNPEYKP